MMGLANVFIFTVLAALCLLAVGVVVSRAMKSRSSIQVMILGIGIILTGGIVAADPSSNLGGVEYLFVLLGLSFVIGGFAKKDS